MRYSVPLSEIPERAHPIRYEAVVNPVFAGFCRLLRLHAIVLIIHVFIQIALYIVYFQYLLIFSLNM